MRVLVCGSRSWGDYRAIFLRLAALPAGTTIVHGAARGADIYAAKYALTLGFAEEAYPADWDAHGKNAGFVRNTEMLDTRPDLVIAFWDGASRGTRHTIIEAKRRGIPVEVIGP